MPRPPRFHAPGQPQHVVQRGANRMAMFREPGDLALFCDCLQDALTREACRLHAYVLMTNHFHLLMTPPRRGATGRVMQSIGRRYVQLFNRKYARTGVLWESRYRATVIDTDRYLLTCYRYIELNPVRAGLVDRAAAYHWSSHATNAYGAVDRLVTPHERYLALDVNATARLEAYRALFRYEIDESTLQRIRSATNGGRSLRNGNAATPQPGRRQRKWKTPTE